MIRPLASVVLGACLLAGPPAAQAIEDPGPWPVGWDDFQFSHLHAASPSVTARIYYPALTPGRGETPDPSGGPYPAVAMIHGSGTFPFDYDLICTHIASYGFVVGTVGTVADFTLTIPSDVRGLLHWLTEESADPGAFFADMVSGDPWSAVGHSSGAVALFSLVSMESAVAQALAVEPSWFSQPGVGDFDGDALIVAGSEDSVTPPASHAELYLLNATGTQRRLYYEVQGSGHHGMLDTPLGLPTTLSHAEAHRLHRRAVTGFLRAEVLGLESGYRDVLGEGIVAEPVEVESQSVDTLQWLGPSDAAPGSVAWGVARTAGNTAVWIVGPALATVPTIYGSLGIQPASMILFGGVALGAQGLDELTIPIPASLSGITLHFQTLAVQGFDGAFSSVTSFTIP